MDFSKIDTKADATQGRIYQFLHPQLRHPLWTGKGANENGELVDETLPHDPVTVRVLGVESAKAKAAAKVMATAIKNGKDGDKRGLEFAASLVREFDGIENDGEPVTADREGCLWLFGRSEDFAVQIIDAAQDKAGFFKASSKT